MPALCRVQGQWMLSDGILTDSEVSGDARSLRFISNSEHGVLFYSRGCVIEMSLSLFYLIFLVSYISHRCGSPMFTPAQSDTA